MDTEETVRVSKLQQLGDVIDEKFITGFSPAYFTLVMGTGISSTILYNFPYPAYWLKVCGIIMWSIGIGLFIFTTVFFLISLIKCPKNRSLIHRDPLVALFMGCYPMGYISLINFLYLLVGKDWIIGIYVLWWLAVVLSLYTSCVTFYMALMAKYHKQANRMDPQNIQSTLLLPIVTLTVASSAGGLITPDLPSVNLKIITTVVSYILWVNAVTLAFIIVTIYYWKLFLYKIPPTQLVFTTFLPIGVMGQGSYSILLLGNNIYKLVWEHRETFASHLSYADDVTSVISLEALAVVVGNGVLYITAFASLFLTSFGYFCTFIAVVSCLTKIHPFTPHHNPLYTHFPEEGASAFSKLFKGFIKFNKGFWSMTFPLGTMSLSNTELWRVFNNLKAFRVIGALYGATLFVITISCIIGVIYRTVQIIIRIFFTKNLKKASMA